MSILILFFVLIFPQNFISISSSLHVQYGGNINLNYLGTVDGKSFFAQMLPLSTWEEVRTLCSQSGMQMASITLIRQKELLVSTRNPGTFSGLFWTSGRDAQSPSQFVWDTNVVPNSTVVDELVLDSDKPVTCLIFDNDPPTTKGYGFISRSCANPHRILCEITHEQ